MDRQTNNTNAPARTFSRPTRDNNRRVDRGQSSNRFARRGKPMPRRSASPTEKENTVPIPSSGENLRIIPLGGVEEIGKNMTVIEYKDDIIVVDAGFQFTDDDTPGVDYILPNVKYLEDRKDRIRALVITHGHLDHIGAIPYVIDRLGNPPIYSREFGALLIKKRQEEFLHLPPLDVRVAGKNDATVPISTHFKLRFFGLTHSIPDSTGVILETPMGDIVFTGDVRVENDDSKATAEEYEQYKMFKDRNVLMLAMDSTGIDRPGWSMSEKVVLKNIDEIVRTVGGRILIATFASQVERIIAFIDMAKKYNKKIIVEGRSMKTNVAIVKQLELTDLSHIVPMEDIENYPPDKVMIIATGAQGEEFAALMRISNKSHKYIRLNDTDTVILSSSVIPGNERSISKLKDNLYRHNARIITYTDSDVHTSGHGKRGELEWIHHQIPYKFFMPVHGEHFRLKMHAEMARTLGAPKENVVVPDDGSIVEISPDASKISILPMKVPASDMVVDGFAIGDVQEVVMRDRKMLAEDGFVVIVASINVKTGRLKKSPDIISRGFVYLRESQDLLQQTRIMIKRAIEKSATGMNPINFDFVKSSVNEAVEKFLYQKTAKRPIVIPVILGI